MAKRKCLYFCPVFFLIILVIFSSLNSKIKPPEMLPELHKDISEFPIADLQICPDKLPEDESIIPLTIKHFTGYNYGCMNDKGNITSGECDPTKEPIGFPINGFYPKGKNLSVWYANLCAKNYKKDAKNMNAYEYLMKNSVEEFKDCKEGQQKCGKIDTQGSFFCAKKEDKCPITDISILSSNLTKEGYEVIKLAENKFLYYTTLPSKGTIIKSLKVIEGLPCLYSNYIESKYPQFPLDNSFEFYTCPSIRYKSKISYYNNKDVKLDSMKKSDFFSMNDLNNMQKRFSKKVDFPFNSLDEEVNLYYSNYFGYKQNCITDTAKFFEKFSIEKYNTLKDRFSTIKKTSVGIIVVSSIATVLCLLPSCYLMCTSDSYEEKDAALTLGAGIPLFFIGLIIPSGMSFHQAINLYTIPECGRDTSEMFISMFNDTINRTVAYTIIIFASSFIFLSLMIVFFMAGYCINSLKKCCGDDGNDCCGGDCCDDCCEDC